MYLSVHAKYFAPDISFFRTIFAHGVTQIENIPDLNFVPLHPGLRLKPSLDNLISYF